MPATASIEDLRATAMDLANLKGSFPDAYAAFEALLKSRRSVGYRNICRLLLGETTPEKLKQE